MPKIGERFNPCELFEGIYIVNPVLKYRGLSPGSKLVWGRLYRFAGKKGKIFPSVSTVADDLGLSRKQTRRYLHELVESEFLGVEQDPGHSNDYFFRWHAAFEGDRGVHRAALPLPYTGVPDTGVPGQAPLPYTGVPTPPVYGSTPLPYTGVIREEVREEGLREETLIPFSSPLREENPEPPPATGDSQEPAADNAKGGGWSERYDLQLDEPVLTFIANAYKQSRGAKLMSNAALKKLAFMIGPLEERHGQEVFRAALWNYLNRSDDYLRENKWPLRLFLSDPDKYDTGTQPARSESREPKPLCGNPRTPAPVPAPVREDYQALWDAAVPERPAGSLTARTQNKLRLAERDPDFTGHFGAICAKALRLIAAGEPTTFSWLFSGSEKDPNWAGLLEGKFDFLMKRSKPKAGGIDWEAIEREAAAEAEKEKQ